MLPSLTVSARPRLPAPRALMAIAIGSVLIAAMVLRMEGEAGVTAAVVPLALRLERSHVGLTLPIGWLSAPLTGLASDDRLDVLGVRPGDLASVYPLATDARVLGQDERSLTVSLRPDDAAQIALARANGLLLVPLLRPRR